jgi:uroporphyrinogen-III decarboxylase
MTSRFSRFIFDSLGRLAMPIGINAGLPIIGVSVQQALTHPKIQADAILALHDRLDTQILMTAMDLRAESEIHHFGTPMDLAAAFNRVDAEIILSGNLDPSAVFISGTPQSIRLATHTLLDSIGSRKDFVISLGCDLQECLLKIVSFFAAVRDQKNEDLI